MPKLKSKRKNETYLIFAESEGGDYKIFSDWNKAKFKQLVKHGWFDYRDGDAITRVYPTFATLAQGIDNRDFRLEEIQHKRKTPHMRVGKISRTAIVQIDKYNEKLKKYLKIKRKLPGFDITKEPKKILKRPIYKYGN